MTASSQITRLFRRPLLAAFVVGLMSFVPGAQALLPSVSYSPAIQAPQGIPPYSSSYQLAVTAPNNLTGTSTVSLVTQVNAMPAGALTATALSYVTISPSTLTFTAANQVQTVTVTLSIPANAITGAYGYQIYSQGWVTLTAPIDNGASINASASPFKAGGSPPAVNISTPADQSTFSATSFPATINLTFAATALATDPVVSVDANLDGASISVTPTGVSGNTTVTGSGTITVSQPGTYHVQARATNDAGTSADVNTFTVTATGTPPTVTITSPTDGQIFNIISGVQSFTTFNFGAVSALTPITAMTATLNGVPVLFTAAGLNSLAVTGTTANFGLNAAGAYTLVVTATNAYGTGTSSITYTIAATVLPPTPTITINDPDPITYEHTTGTPALNLPFSFVTTTSAGFTVSAVSATLDGSPVTIDATTGLGQITATSNGTLAAVPAGTHTFVAYGTSAGIQVSSSVTFTVQDVAPLVPPSVVINTLGGISGTVQASFNLVGSSINIPLAFTGTSNNAGGVITGLTATLDPDSATPVPLTVSWTSAGISVGTATVNVATAGQHTIKVTATDEGGTATASTVFTVVPAAQQVVQGTVFFDANFNGVLDGSEPGLGGVTVKLYNSTDTTVVASTVTAATGKYTFTVAPAIYHVVVSNSITGLSPTTPNLDQTITVSTTGITAGAVGFGLNFTAIRGLKSCALSQGYWKNNVSKALSGKTCGMQVSVTALKAYTTQISSLALAPFNGMTLNTANSVFNSKSQLDLQLLASEYNYVSGAYINGSQTLTLCFIYWGEIVKQNTGNVYSSSYQTFAANWFTAYNMSEGGYVNGPSS